MSCSEEKVEEDDDGDDQEIEIYVHMFKIYVQDCRSRNSRY